VSRAEAPVIQRTLLVAGLRGFCAGVVRAIDVVQRAIEVCDGPVYVRKEIIHNRYVVEELREKGARFVEEIHEVPDGAWLIYSAHGVSPAVREDASRKRLRTIDATCPLVTKVHLEAIRYARSGFEIILIGHPSHEEVEGTLGEAADRMTLVSTVAEAEAVQVKNPERLAFLTQTTLSVEDTRPIVAALQRRFPGIQGPARADICYATQNRQLAVRAIAREAPVILVVGSKNSSNSNRLVEEAELAGARAYLVDDVSGMNPAWLDGVSAVGVTSGASAPDFLVDAILETLRRLGATEVREVRVVDEDVFFPLPPELAALRKARESALAPSVS